MHNKHAFTFLLLSVMYNMMICRVKLRIGGMGSGRDHA